MIARLAQRNWVVYHYGMRNKKGQFVKGLEPWNKNTKGIMKVNSGSFQKGHGKVELSQRFWEKVQITDNCWLWKASVNNQGYGRINVDGDALLSHRVVFFLEKGYWPPQGMTLMHTCDNTFCVRPDHLVLGTQADNMRDMAKKQRGCNGEKAPWAKLRQQDVDEIRKIYASGGIAMRPLAKKFNVSYTTVNFIINNKSWK